MPNCLQESNTNSRTLDSDLLRSLIKYAHLQDELESEDAAHRQIK